MRVGARVLCLRVGVLERFVSAGVRVLVCAYRFGCLVLACADVGDAVKTFMSAGCVGRVSLVRSFSARRTRSAHFTYIGQYDFHPTVVLACFKQPSSCSSVNTCISTGPRLRKMCGSKFLSCGMDKTKWHSVGLCVAFSDRWNCQSEVDEGVFEIN